MKKKTIDKKKRNIIIFTILWIILLLAIVYSLIIKYYAIKSCDTKYEYAKAVKIDGDYYCCSEVDSQLGCWRIRYGKEK